MARLFTLGFELNSLTAGVEFTTSIGSYFTIQGTTKRTGGYAGKILNPNGYGGVSYQFASSNIAGNIFSRIYLRIHAYPPGSSCIMGLTDTDVGVNPNSLGITIRLQSNGTLLLFNNNSGSQVGS